MVRDLCSTYCIHASQQTRQQSAANLCFCCTGFSAAQLFGQGVSYTYDDVIMHPGHISFPAHEVRSICQPAAYLLFHKRQPSWPPSVCSVLRLHVAVSLMHTLLAAHYAGGSVCKCDPQHQASCAHCQLTHGHSH